MKDFFLLIDDVRDLLDVDLTVRTAPEGREALQSNPVTHLILDNDLGSNQDMEGIEILQWARDNGYVPPNVFIISANTVAKKRMEDVLNYDMKYTYWLDGWWRKP